MNKQNNLILEKYLIDNKDVKDLPKIAALQFNVTETTVYNYLKRLNLSPNSKIRWAREETAILVSLIKQYPTNINYACEEASKVIDRNKEACLKYYYKVLKKDPSLYMLTTGSKEGFSQNVKNQHRDKEDGTVKQNLQPFMIIMKELLDLSKEDRDRILTFFK